MSHAPARRRVPAHAGEPEGRVSDLSHLISPIDVELFKREYWGKQPLIVHRPDRSHYANLLTLDDVDEILSTTSPLSGQVQAVREGKARPSAKNPAALGGGGPEGWFEEYRSGSTIVLQSLHERWPSLKRLCRSLAAEFSAGFQVNVYLTPPNAQGLSTHYDTHDVFVVQVAGTKRWRIYERTMELPLYGQAYPSNASETGRVLHELELQAGSAMYLPRGFAHQASSTESASIHLAVGALTVTWASVVLTAVEKVIEQNARFRSALPPGFAESVERRREAEAASRAKDQAKRLAEAGAGRNSEEER
jgi:ribosomal protein L16 Arg81 hydroxylase